jgi:hypothetical protein
MKNVLPALLLVCVAGSAQTYNAHPRVLLTPSLVSDIQNQYSMNTALWQNVKSIADSYNGIGVYKLTIASVTNANPGLFTTNENDVSCSTSPGSSPLFMAGWAGANWSSLNQVSATQAAVSCVKVSSNSFKLWNGSAYIDTTTWGTAAGLSSVVIFNGSGDCDPAKICYGYEGGRWYQALAYLSMAYVGSGTASYATSALALFDYINSLAGAGIYWPYIIDSAYAARSTGWGMAIAYDWLYLQLSSEEKSAYATTLGAWYDYCQANSNGQCYAYNSTQSGYPAGWNGASTYITNNYWTGYLLSLGLGALACGENSGGCSRASEIYNNRLTQWNNNKQVFANNYGNGEPGIWNGGWPLEGHNYGVPNLVKILLWIDGVNTAIGTDLGLTATAESFQTAYEYFAKPDRWETDRFYSSPGTCSGILRKSLPMVLSGILAGSTQGAFAQWQYQHFASIPSGISSSCTTDFQDDDDAFTQLIFYRSSRTQTDYRLTEPTYYTDPGTGMMIWRSDWTDNAFWLEWVGDPLNTEATTKQWRAAGAIDLVRGSDSLIVGGDAYWYGITGANGGGTTGEEGASGYESTIYFEDGCSWMYYCNSNNGWGGQGYNGIFYSFLSKQTSTYSYQQVDLTPAYCNSNNSLSSRTLRYAFRTVSAMPGGVFFVYDRTYKTSTSYTIQQRWSLSPQGMPSVSSGTLMSTVGSSKVWIRPVSAVNSGGSTAVSNTTISPGGGSNPAVSQTYQWQLSDSVSNTTLNLLTAIYGDSSSASAPTITSLTSSSNAVAAQVVGSGAPAIFVHSNVVTDPGGSSYATAKAQSSLTFTSTHSGSGNYLVGGLIAGNYTITGNCSTNCSPTVGADGTLYFTGTSGPYSIYATCQISPSSLGPWTNTQVVNQMLTEAGCSASTFSLNGSWPTRLSGCSSGSGPTCTVTGTISGTGAFTPLVSYSSATNNYSITVNAAPSITTSSLPGGRVGQAYSQIVNTIGGTSPLSCSITSGALPNGLSLNSGTCMISGTPTLVGSYGFTITVTDANAVVANQLLVISISAPGGTATVSGGSCSGCRF